MLSPLTRTAALLAAAATLGTATPAIAQTNSISINSAAAKGGKNAAINVTYTCDQNLESPFIAARLKFSWGNVYGRLATLTCDGQSHTTDVSVSSNYNTIKRGEKAEAGVQLQQGSVLPEVVVSDTKRLTLG
ncbi:MULTISPECIES: hypothetical protein [unclassified Nonomuraea]|uniref:hypothetical protein n=1 Tax=unclassified Nonomuraea TaxID=2593643 RepID=UPI0035C1D211